MGDSHCAIEKGGLILCRPFAPSLESDASSYTFCFVLPDHLDARLIASLAEYHDPLLIEPEIAEAVRQKGAALPDNARELPGPLSREGRQERQPKVVFLASSDTHANFMLRIAERFARTLFVVPAADCKDEGAIGVLKAHGISPVTIRYTDRQSQAVAEFKPDVVLCGADWTSEFYAMQAIAHDLDVPVVALQEGPQDWRMTINGYNPRKYLNADVLLAQGPVTLKYIRPKYFAVTGNPKVDRIEALPLPAEPKVFINCNFTYGEQEQHRERWMGDVLGLCKELQLDYLISKHPRDRSQWDDPNLVISSALTVREQLASCSIVVSRFSNIPYEGLALGRPAVYYNPHGEPPRTFTEDDTPGLTKAFNRSELKRTLEGHKRGPRFDAEAALATMKEHCGPMDGRSLERILETLSGVVTSRVAEGGVFVPAEERTQEVRGETLFSVVVCTHNRPGLLDRALRSVLRNPQRAARYEVIVVDNRSREETATRLERYRRIETVRVLREERPGLSHARNTGWRAARGRYVVFLDDDAEVAPDWLLGFRSVFQAHPDAAACGGRIVPVYAVGKPYWIEGISERYYGKYDLGGDVLRCEWVPGGNAAWRRDVLEQLGGFDPQFGRVGGLPISGGEESQLIHQATRTGRTLYYTPHALMYHLISAERVTRRYLGARHFGQGLTEIRYAAARHEMNRDQMFRYAVYGTLKALRLMPTVAKRVLVGDRAGAHDRFFELCHMAGRATECWRQTLAGGIGRRP